jgi:protein involved in polysaccharide export with SLBB domain
MRAIWSLLAALLAATLVAQPTDYTLDTGDVIAVVVLRHSRRRPTVGTFSSQQWNTTACCTPPSG